MAPVDQPAHRPPIHPVVADVTARVTDRSRASRTASSAFIAPRNWSAMSLRVRTPRSPPSQRARYGVAAASLGRHPWRAGAAILGILVSIAGSAPPL